MPNDDFLEIPPARVDAPVDHSPGDEISSVSIVPTRIETIYNISWDSPENTASHDNC